jgi:hypothetical protein
MQAPPSANPPEGYPAPATTAQSNTGAVVSLVLGIVSLLVAWIPFVGLIGIVTGIIGAVFGHRGLAQSRSINTGRGMSVAGLILNYLSILVAVLITAFLVFVVIGIAKNCQTVQGQCGTTY